VPNGVQKVAHGFIASLLNATESAALGRTD